MAFTERGANPAGPEATGFKAPKSGAENQTSPTKTGTENKTAVLLQTTTVLGRRELDTVQADAGARMRFRKR